MTEKTVSQSKNRITMFILCFILIILKGLHGAGLRGMTQPDVYLALIAGAFTFAFVLSMNIPSDGKILSVQHLLGVVSACGLVLGVFEYHEISVEVFAMLAVYAGGMMFVKEIRYLPVAAAIAVLSHAFIQYTSISAIPVLFAAGFIINWHKVREASVVDKIIFAVSEAVLFGAGAYCFKIFKDSFTFDSFKAHWLSSAVTVLMAILVLYVAFRTFRSKGGKIEALGYIFLAAAAIPQSMMTSRNKYMVVVSLTLTLVVAANCDTYAKKIFNGINETVTKKLCK